MTSIQPQERATQFVGALRTVSVRQDRGALAALRRGLSKTTVMDAWPVVSRLGGSIGLPGESVFLDIGALYATHPVESQAPNFGATCRALALKGASVIAASYESRFRRLLASDSTSDLVGQLRTWVRLASASGIGVNYESLFADLWNWRRYADDIRIRWAREFWQSGVDRSPMTSTPEVRDQPESANAAKT